MTGKAKAELLRNLDAATDVLKEAPAQTQPCLHVYGAEIMCIACEEICV